MGNKYFREAIAASLEEYMQKQSRFEKSFVVQNIVDEIHGRGGRFLKQDSRTGRYTIELTMTQSREKVGHAIRDAANLHTSKQRQLPQQQQQRNYDVPISIPVAAVEPRTAAAAAAAAATGRTAAAPSAVVSSRPSAKRPRQTRDSFGSSSSLISMVGEDHLSPYSGRDTGSRNLNPNVLYQSPIQHSSNVQQQRPGHYTYDPSSPSESTTSLYRFESLVNPNNSNSADDIAGNNPAFPLQTQLQSTPAYQMNPQLYHQRQQLRQQQLYQQQLLQPPSGGNNDPFYTNYPSQQLATYNIPIPQQQQPSALPRIADPRQPPKQEAAGNIAELVQQSLDTAPLLQQTWMHRPYMTSTYNMPQHNMDHPLDVSASSLDAYTQILFQEQQERFYREYQAGQHRPPNPMGHILPPHQQNDDNDVFLDAIDSVLGPMDPDNNNNNHFDDGLQQQPLPDRTGIVHGGTRSMETQRMMEQPSLRSQSTPHEQSDSPSSSVEEQKLASSYPIRSDLSATKKRKG